MPRALNFTDHLRPLTLGAGILAIDQLIKVVLYWLKPEWLLGNRGVAFGWSAEYPLQLTILILAALCCAVILYSLPRSSNSELLRWACVLFIAGAASNLIDRIGIGHGQVIDYLPFLNGLRLNLGDVSITLALLGFVRFVLTG